VLRAGVLNGQLLATALAAQKPREKCGAVFSCAVTPGARCVVADHLTDRLCAVPVDVPFVRARLQCQPFLPRPAPDASLGTRSVVAHGCARLAVSIRTAIGRVGDDLVDGRISRAAPDDVTIVSPRRQVELVFKKPQECLPHATQFGNLVDDQADCRLHSSVWILLQLVAGFNEANRGCDDQFATPTTRAP